VIVVLADLALKMSVTRLARACLAAALLWVEAAATIAVRSASARLAAPVSVLKSAARFEGGFSVSSWLSWFCQRPARFVECGCDLSVRPRRRLLDGRSDRLSALPQLANRRVKAPLELRRLVRRRRRASTASRQQHERDHDPHTRDHDERQTLLEAGIEECRRRGVTFRELAHEYLRWLEDVKDAKPSTLRDDRILLAEPGSHTDADVAATRGRSWRHSVIARRARSRRARSGIF
jgi:hypothetical protein